MAHHDGDVYRDGFELALRRESALPTDLWQADHTKLDVMVVDETGKAVRPGLTVILDDRSTAVAGYTVFLERRHLPGWRSRPPQPCAHRRQADKRRPERPISRPSAPSPPTRTGHRRRGLPPGSDSPHRPYAHHCGRWFESPEIKNVPQRRSRPEHRARNRPQTERLSGSALHQRS